MNVYRFLPLLIACLFGAAPPAAALGTQAQSGAAQSAVRPSVQAQSGAAQFGVAADARTQFSAAQFGVAAAARAQFSAAQFGVAAAAQSAVRPSVQAQSGTAQSAAQAEAARAAIVERIRPPGSVCREGDADCAALGSQVLWGSRANRSNGAAGAGGSAAASSGTAGSGVAGSTAARSGVAGSAAASSGAAGSAAGSAAAARSGEAVYRAACLACHASGIANAPKLGDAAAWADRIAKGMDALYSAGLNGIPGTTMVARGGCFNCTDEEIKAAVDYMVEESR